MADVESTLITEVGANNIAPPPDGLPSSSSPNAVYPDWRELAAMSKRWWNRVNPTITSGGAVNAQTLTYGVAPLLYTLGQQYAFIAGFANSGALTLNVNGLGAKTVQSQGVALVGGEIKVGQIVEVVYDGTQFQIISGQGSYLPLAGGTLSGALTVSAGNIPLTLNGPASAGVNLMLNKASGATPGYPANIQGQAGGLARWVMALGNNAIESGSNSGSDFSLSRMNDAGTLLDAPLTITRASGLATFADNIALNGAAGTLRQIVAQTSGSPRWALNIAGAGAEGGSNAGSDLGIWRYTDAGTFIDTPLTITRSTGLVTLTGAPNALNFNNVVSFRQMTWSTSGSQRWSMGVNNTAEGGANAGSDFFIGNFADAGAGSPLAQPIQIKRSTGVTTFSVAIVNGPSDRTLKENIEPLDGALDKVKALQGVSFNMKTTPEKREIGLIAQDVEAIVPEIIQPFQNGEDKPKLALDYPKLTALLIEAVKSLTERIEKLEARLPLAPETA